METSSYLPYFSVHVFVHVMSLDNRFKIHSDGQDDRQFTLQANCFHCHSVSGFQRTACIHTMTLFSKEVIALTFRMYFLMLDSFLLK